jgi:hypothetical protein
MPIKFVIPAKAGIHATAGTHLDDFVTRIVGSRLSPG